MRVKGGGGGGGGGEIIEDLSNCVNNPNKPYKYLALSETPYLRALLSRMLYISTNAVHYMYCCIVGVQDQLLGKSLV